MISLAFSSDKPEPNHLMQFERMLARGLKKTSDTITEKRTHEIPEVSHRTSVLEQRRDEQDLLTGAHAKELKIIHEENLTLQARLEDFENRARCSNLHICGIPESVVDLQSAITVLF